MFLRILKKDLKRKKTMNIILLLFIIFASMFVASGLDNVVTVLNGTDYYFDKAGLGDYAIITMGEDSLGHIGEVFGKKDGIRSCRVEEAVYGAQHAVLFQNGEETETKNTVLFQSLEDAALAFFDIENREVKTVEQGHAWVSGKFLEENSLKEGDSIRIRIEGVELELVLDGKVKDALLGSDFMGNQRFLLNRADMDALLRDENIRKHYRGEIGYLEADDVSVISSSLSDVPGVAFSGDRAMLKMCYVMEMIVAFVVLIFSVCLIVVSFVVLKFSINFTILEEFREIGVMKAIGITNRKIRGIYISKYLLLSVVGAAVGCLVSIPFGNLLLQYAGKNMMLGNDIGIWVNAAGAVLVIAIILLFAWRCTGRVKKSSPLDAIRSGQTGERFRKKAVCRIGKSHLGINLYLAANDVLSNIRRFATIIVSFFLCTLLVLIFVNTTQTMESPNLIDTFGTRSDLYVTDVSNAMKYMRYENKEKLKKYLDARGEELAEHGMPASVCVEIQYKYKAHCKGKEYMLSFQQGVGTDINDYKFQEGTVPGDASEIAITPRISEMTGVKIGDTVTIDFGTGKKDCIVTAYFQTMNLLGELCLLHEDAPTEFKNISSVLQDKINFTDQPGADEIEKRKERIRELYGNDKVMDQTEYCVDCIGVVDMMKAVQFLLLAITLVVVLLVTILMERSFIADEKNEIAILKAVGFRDSDVIRWQVYRFGIIALLSAVLAAAASIPMTKLCISPVFGMMGARDVEYNISPLQIFVLYPAIVCAFTILIAWITALYTKTISSRDITNIE